MQFIAYQGLRLQGCVLGAHLTKFAGQSHAMTAALTQADPEGAAQALPAAIRVLEVMFQQPELLLKQSH